MNPLAAIAVAALATARAAGGAGEAPADLQTRPSPPPSPLPAPPLAGERPGEVRLGQPPAPEGAPEGGTRRFPFPAAKDLDGSRFPWFLMDRAGIPCEYLPGERAAHRATSRAG